jgi:hypothetical protein
MRPPSHATFTRRTNFKFNREDLLGGAAGTSTCRTWMEDGPSPRAARQSMRIKPHQTESTCNPPSQIKLQSINVQGDLHLEIPLVKSYYPFHWLICNQKQNHSHLFINSR